MEYRKYGDTYLVRIDRGEEILASIKALCTQEKIALATIDGLGAIDHAVVCVYDVVSKTFFRKTFDEPMEISSLTGTVTEMDGEVYLHVHATVCDRELRAHGGHVNELRVAATSEIVVRTLPGHVGRVLNEDIGLNLFAF